MSEPKSFASLSPTLLARKGGARPAMRPQLGPIGGDALARQLDDLGWNDMGHDHGGASELPSSGADIVPIHADIAADTFAAGAGPIVRRQQRRLEERVLADAAMTGHEEGEPDYDEAEEYTGAALYGEAYEDDAEDEGDAGIYSPLATRSAPAPQPAAAPAPRRAAKTRMPAVQSGRRAAFTLRLDADRHLKLRLAATMQGVSAQALVTEALDHLLAEYDVLDVIANHLKRH